METAHLAKNQILQQAANAMLVQPMGQQGLLQLIQKIPKRREIIRNCETVIVAVYFF